MHVHLSPVPGVAPDWHQVVNWKNVEELFTASEIKVATSFRGTKIDPLLSARTTIQ